MRLLLVLGLLGCSDSLTHDAEVALRHSLDDTTSKVACHKLEDDVAECLVGQYAPRPYRCIRGEGTTLCAEAKR